MRKCGASALTGVQFEPDHHQTESSHWRVAMLSHRPIVAAFIALVTIAMSAACASPAGNRDSSQGQAAGNADPARTWQSVTVVPSSTRPGNDAAEVAGVNAT